MTCGDNLVHHSYFRSSAPSSGRFFKRFGEVQPQLLPPNGAYQDAEKPFDQPSSCSRMPGRLEPGWSVRQRHATAWSHHESCRSAARLQSRGAKLTAGAVTRPTLSCP